MSAVLQLDVIRKTYTRRNSIVSALRDVSLQVEAGEFKVVHGPSGSGKTTLLLIAGGLLAPDSGSVKVSGESMYSLTPEARAAFRARGIGYVFQQFHLIPYLSVLENVLAPSLAQTESSNGNTDEIRARAAELVSYFGLSERAAHSPSELSTGEKQRVALARALLNKPSLLLADEPTGNLDEKNAATVIDYMKEFAKAGGAVLVATHDSSIRADEKYELDGGVLLHSDRRRDSERP